MELESTIYTVLSKRLVCQTAKHVMLLVLRGNDVQYLPRMRQVYTLMPSSLLRLTGSGAVALLHYVYLLSPASLMLNLGVARFYALNCW